MKSYKILLTLTCAALAALTQTANALDVAGMKIGVGPKLSLNMNKATLGDVGGSSYGYGWGLGAVSILDLEPVAFELGLNYSEKRHEFSDLLGLDGDYAITLKQIEIPILAYYKLTLNESLALRAGAGAQLEFGIGKVKGDSGSLTYSEAGISKNNYSLLIDVGTDYKISELGSLSIDLRYAHGLKDRSEENGLFSDKFKGHTIELAAGFLF